jgi:hypothetical protein
MASSRPRKIVWVHHLELDRDGDLICYYDVTCGASARYRYQSSPVAGIRKAGSAIIEQAAGCTEGNYIIATQSTDYEVQLPQQVAAQIEAILLAGQRYHGLNTLVPAARPHQGAKTTR